jgi:hypothetical protein
MAAHKVGRALFCVVHAVPKFRKQTFEDWRNVPAQEVA